MSLPLILLASCTPKGIDPLVWGTDDTTPAADDSSVVEAPLVLPEHERELRGVWVATVFNINFPSATGRSASQLRTELEGLVDTAEATGLNAIFFQVRPEGDALYDSAIEPWSRYLSGTQGGDPGLDPLQTLLELAHPRGIEVHAWFNPYRGKASASSSLADGHLCLELPSACHRYGNNLLWMDPGVPEVRERTREVVLDVATRYDVDGVHFDDYFYPYPDGSQFPDDASFSASGTSMSRDDWRRDNVNTLIAELHEALAADAPRVRFGIAPFGIYRPGVPSGISGLDQYASLYADPVAWMEGGWLHYQAPQLYWPTTQTAQAYETLLRWWSQTSDVPIFAGNALYRLGESGFTLDEFRRQVDLSRAMRGEGSLGNIWYNIDTLEANTQGMRALLHDEYYAELVLPPSTPGVDRAALGKPDVTAADGALTVSLPADARAWVVYRSEGEGWTHVATLPPATTSLAVEPGRYAVTLAERGAVEGPAVVVEL